MQLYLQNDVFSSLSTTLKGSAGRLGRMAQSGNRVAVLKLAGLLVGGVLVLWIGAKYIF
jgi:blocked early in transport 1